MRVIATAGHVDHGKSTLVRTLTGMEPDRWAEERRRGLTIGLGYAWTTIGGVDLAFVDVPGHERFVTTMLTGVGPVPSVLFVVAADEGWMPQSTEHLAVLDAFGVLHGLLVITRSDRADPASAQAEALDRIRRTSLGEVPSVAVSAVTGLGMDELRSRLVTLAGSLPPPDPHADVRLWIDRGFTIEGAGTVVTGTLAAGTITTGDELCLSSGTRVQVRGMQSLGRSAGSVRAVARIAVNLRGLDRTGIRAGAALLTPGAWTATDLIDVRLPPGPTHLILHIGSASVPVRVRPLGTASARLQLNSALPLRIGDRVVLRDPGRHEITAGADILDLDPPPLTRRGSARRRGIELDDVTDLTELQLRQHGFLRPERFRTLGLPTPVDPPIAGWHVHPELTEHLTTRIKSEVDTWRTENPLRPDVPLEILRQRLGVPSVELTRHLAEQAGVTANTHRPLPANVAKAIETLVAELRATPFRAPEAERLRELGLGTRELAAAVRTGALIRIAAGVVLLPGSLEQAAQLLSKLTHPFALSEARQTLNTSRRVAVPLMERLDTLGITRRAPDGTPNGDPARQVTRRRIRGAGVTALPVSKAPFRALNARKESFMPRRLNSTFPFESMRYSMGHLFDIFRKLVNAEQREAVRERELAPCVIPGLLQTAGYAGALVTSAHRFYKPETRRQDVIAARMRRQKPLEGSDPLAVIDEGVIRRQIGGPDVMREQLAHLLVIAEKSNITVQALPFVAGAYGTMNGSCIILDYAEPDDPPGVYLEYPAGGAWVEDPDDVKRFTAMFDDVSELALSPSDTTDLIHDQIRTLKTH